MNERSISSIIDSKYHRARCPSCGVTCEQRRRTVRDLRGDIRLALECIECEMVYLVTEQTDRLPDGWSVDPDASHLASAYIHTTGARVQRIATDRVKCWWWYPSTASYGSKCYSPMVCMLDAMTAALGESVAEVHARLELEYGCVNCTMDRGARECAESGHQHCDALKVDDVEQPRGERP